MNKRERRECEMVKALWPIGKGSPLTKEEEGLDCSINRFSVMETQDFIAEINEITTIEEEGDVILWTFVGSEWADLTPIERARANRYNYELACYGDLQGARLLADKVQDALVPLGLVSLGEVAKVDEGGYAATLQFAMTV